jgi:hypothetical protein
MTSATLPTLPTKVESQRLHVENIGLGLWQIRDGERAFEVQRSASLYEADYCTCGAVHQPGRTARCAHMAAVEISIFYFWNDVESAVALECFHGVQLVDSFSSDGRVKKYRATLPCHPDHQKPPTIRHFETREEAEHWLSLFQDSRATIEEVMMVPCAVCSGIGSVPGWHNWSDGWGGVRLQCDHCKGTGEAL